MNLAMVAASFIPSFLVGAGNALFWIKRAEKRERAAFERGCRSNVEWAEAACAVQRAQIVNRMLNSGVPDVERFAEILVKLHYLCPEGCQVDHAQPEEVH